MDALFKRGLIGLLLSAFLRTSTVTTAAKNSIIVKSNKATVHDF